MRLRNVDIYVTGSNSKMLSKDVMTEFRGRGDAVEVYESDEVVNRRKVACEIDFVVNKGAKKYYIISNLH